MRVLFHTCLNKSHLYLVTPLAWAMQAAGHEVRMAVAPDLAGDVAGLGLLPVAVGEPMTTLGARLNAAEPRHRHHGAAHPGARQHDYARDDANALLRMHATEFFAVLSPDRTIEDLVLFARAWRPDLVVWNTLAFAGPVAARACGAAHARMVWSVDTLAQLRARSSTVGTIDDPMRQWLEPVLGRFGVPFDDEIVLGQQTIDPAPDCVWQHGGGSRLPLRQVPFNGPPREALPDWVDGKGDRPRVCVTLGVSGRESGAGSTQLPVTDLFDAVADLDVEVIATLDAAQLRSPATVPDNVRAVDFVPLGALLPSCAAVVHHGGVGTFTSALAHGTPQLTVPGTFWHLKWWGPVAQAEGLERTGAGIYVADADGLTAGMLRAALDRVLADPSFAAGAARLRAGYATRPTPNEVVPQLARWTAEHRRS